MEILIVAANFYQDIAYELVRGASEVLQENKRTYRVAVVPGALEIPPVISMAIESREFIGYIALGCVIRGETYHFEIVSQESARGLMDLSLAFQVPIANGILTVENEQQAWERAKITGKNKGGAAASACLELLKLKEMF